MSMSQFMTRHSYCLNGPLSSAHVLARARDTIRRLEYPAVEDHDDAVTMTAIWVASSEQGEIHLVAYGSPRWQGVSVECLSWI